MPKVRRSNVPQPLLAHLLKRMRERNISAEQIVVLAQWLDLEPDVPQGKWFKRFTGFTVVGQGELIKTLLLPGQVPEGQELT
jgi:hypothetical protein